MTVCVCVYYVSLVCVCEWKGKLKKYEQHLNESPAPDNQLDGCQFVEVECKHECGGWFQRRYIATHQDQECLERPYSCEHCNEYDSTFKEVTDIHYAECPNYPVTCPNECRHDPFKRQEIEYHLEDDCPLTKVSCPLHYAGCEVELPRKDMPEHMKDTVTHLALLANVTLSLVKENQELKEKQRGKHGCGGWFQRRYIATHQDQECLERPYSCEHCDSTFKDIHYAVCPKYSVTCPNECQHDFFYTAS